MTDIRHFRSKLRVHRQGCGLPAWRAVFGLVFSLVFSLALGWPVTGAAHVLQSDGTVGVRLHVDPGDEPMVGQSSTFMLEFQGHHAGFPLDRCDCQLLLSLDGKPVFTRALPTEATSAATIAHVFDQAGVYRAEVAGTPRPGADFKPFRVAFDVRVIPDESAPGPVWWWARQYGWMLLAALAVLVTLVTFILKKGKKP